MRQLYILLFLLLVFILSYSQERNLTWVSVSTTYTYEPNTTVLIGFDFDNGGQNNWNNRVVYHSMTFPSGVTVNSASDINENTSTRSLQFNSISGAFVDWGDPSLTTNNGYLRVRRNSTFYVYVTIDPSFSGDMIINFTTKDNLYGSSPHEISGTVTIPENTNTYPYMIRCIENGDELISVEMKASAGFEPTIGDIINDINFGFMWNPSTSGEYTTDLTLVCSDFNIVETYDPYIVWTDGVSKYVRIFTASGSSTLTTTWNTDEWITIATFRAREIMPDANTINTGNWQYDIIPLGWFLPPNDIDPLIVINSTSYNPEIYGEVFDYPMPTPYDMIWQGGDNTLPLHDEFSWNNGKNWTNTFCPGAIETHPPGPITNVTIPAGCVEYPRYPDDSGISNHSTVLSVTVNNGGEINWDGSLQRSYLRSLDHFYIAAGGIINLINDNMIIDMYFTPPDPMFPNDDSEIYGNLIINDVDSEIHFTDNVNIHSTNGLSSLGWVDVDGDTYIGATEALVLKSNSSGSGSFMNGGDVTYSSNGTAQVETYITGIGNPLGAVYMHFVGPTVHDIAYRNTSTTGVRLEQFNMTSLDTYAYEWDSSVDTNGPANNEHIDPWVNVWPLDYNVPLADGLAITNYVEGEGTMKMEGSLIIGDFSTYTIYQNTDNGIELISNPYPTAINFNEFYEDNSLKIDNKYNIMNGIDNWTQYVALPAGGGVPAGYQYIQMGQGFMALPIASGVQLQFNDDIREHNDVAFRSAENPYIQIVSDSPKEIITDIEIQRTIKSVKHQLNPENWIYNNPTESEGREITPNQLTLIAEGGETDFKDQTSIYFWDGATKDYDEEVESIKWNSMNTDATMIRSITNDNFDLAVNALPLEKLNVEMVSVPIQFECSYEGEYTFTFTEIESFEDETEIWLEDLQEDNYWFSVTPDNNVYTFNASANDGKDRFVVHFFGPTGIDDNISTNKSNIDIYAAGNDLYIISDAEETINEIAVYNMLGSKILHDNNASNSVNKLTINSSTGYYFVRVLTDKNIYSEKVFIMK